MVAEALLMSRDPDLGDINQLSVSDVHLPQLDQWIGEYPVLRRDIFQQVSRELGGGKGKRTPAKTFSLF